MAIISTNSIGLDSKKKVSQDVISLNQTGNKINNGLICSYIFLAIGAIAGFIAAGSFVCVLTVVSPTTTHMIFGISAISTIIGSLSLFSGVYIRKYTAIDCNPKDFKITGIKNTNNNCWLNSLLQVLLNNKELKEALIKNINFKKFVDQYEKALIEGQNPDSQPLRVYLKTICPAISQTGEFQDCHEPLTAILDILRNQIPGLKNTLTTKSYYKNQHDEKKDFSVTESNNGIINLPLPRSIRSVNVKNLVEQYFYSPQNFKSDVMQDLERKVQQTGLRGVFKWNKRVKEKVVVEERKIYLEQRKLAFVPKDLFFNIERYVSDPDVSVDDKLFMDKNYFENEKSANYELFDFIVNINQVHYISYVKRNGVWFLCDDDNVEAVSDAAAAQAAKKAYVLHYKQC